MLDDPLHARLLHHRQVIGDRVRGLREQQGRDQVTFALDCGIGRGTLQRIESGYGPYRLDSLLRIAYALDVPARDLM